MPRAKKEQYMSQEAKQLKEQLDEQLHHDKEMEFARRCIERIPEKRREYVFKLLSQHYAAK